MNQSPCVNGASEEINALSEQARRSAGILVVALWPICARCLKKTAEAEREFKNKGPEFYSNVASKDVWLENNSNSDGTHKQKHVALLLYNI